ncbi:DUF4244 domain-containing protein [Umezawaea endophytica]|uniref:DUF4244 domain-containing protein n=1 Tax=Umezawaea endophytica TaxID=1654476 RepID=A0A9X2VX20_9PSEU|nr:DUF4244 domain-containing protein [Umezawaea endophytica]MCS7484234.1 DUF4244 domain-containing protein [Umezawaea endophytica]
MHHLIREAFRGDDGMTTAEYAIGTLAAAALATALYVVLSGDIVSQLLEDLVKSAFSVGT